MYRRPLIKKNVTAKAGLNSNRLCGILIGQTGAGKTTLGNMLCNTDHLSGASETSVTQQLFRNDVCVGSHAFSLIDTPGTDSQTDTYKHAVLLRAGLTATELSTIFIVLKYDSRYDKMTYNYEQVEQPVGNVTNKIVVLISHMDNAKDHQKEFPKLCSLLTETSPSIANIIFFSELSDSSSIADLMYACMSNMEPKRLEISDDEFHINFNLYQVKIDMRKSFQQYKMHVHKLFGDYARLRDRTKNEPVEDQDELFHVMIVQFKYDIDHMGNAFVEKHGKEMIELEYYALFVEMQKMNVEHCDRFVSSVTPLMTYNLFDNTDPRNLIKACPHCGLVWWKTEGCDGATHCGTRVSEVFDSRSRALFKYTLKWINGELTHTKNPVEKCSVRAADAKPSTKGLGCGQPIVWSQLPKLEDNVLYKIFEVKTMEEIRSVMQKEAYQRARAEYVDGIDTTFHGGKTASAKGVIKFVLHKSFELIFNGVKVLSLALLHFIFALVRSCAPSVKATLPRLAITIVLLWALALYFYCCS